MEYRKATILVTLEHLEIIMPHLDEYYHTTSISDRKYNNILIKAYLPISEYIGFELMCRAHGIPIHSTEVHSSVLPKEVLLKAA